MRVECSICGKIFDDKKIILIGTADMNVSGQRVFFKYLCNKCYIEVKEK